MRRQGKKVRSLLLAHPQSGLQARTVTIDLHGGRSSVSGVVATVFGATGFVGRYVVNRLGKIGSQVIIPYRGEESGYRHLKLLGDLGQIVPIWYNIRNMDSIKRAMQHSNVVINLVGKNCETRNFSFYDANVVSAATIAMAAKECGVERLIHVSSAAASPDSPSGFSRSKALGEQTVRDIFPEATILRPCVLFGRQDFFLNRYAFIHRYWPMPLRTCKDHKMQPLWVSDFATALMNTLARTDTVGKTYELGGPDVFTFQQLTEGYLSEVLARKRFWLDVPKPVMMGLASVWEKALRVPRVTTDEITFMANHDYIVPEGTRNATEDLGVAKASSVDEVGLSFLRNYRIPAYQNLVD